MGTDLIRANRVAVKTEGENFIADFYRTHKAIGSINSENTGWIAPEDATNKTAMRESFRIWAISHCEEFGIEWNPKDMRAPGNIRKPKYDSDQALVDDAMSMLIPEMRALVEKCKYPIMWGSIAHEDIVPMTHTGTGRELSTLGIIDGKYEKSGNWAWADVKFTMTFKYTDEECYLIITMQLVSGQLKKTGIGIMEFNSRVKSEIISAGLATEEELDPPKSSKKKSSDENKDTDEDDYVDVTDEADEDIDINIDEDEEFVVDEDADALDHIEDTTEDEDKFIENKKEKILNDEDENAPKTEHVGYIPLNKRKAKKFGRK